MKLLLDENLSTAQAGILREHGHDAIAATEAGLSGQPDEAIRNFAIESGRVLLTLDADFGNVVRFPTVGTPGVIRLKIHPPSEEDIRESILRTVAALKDTPLAGCLAVAHKHLIRVRRESPPSKTHVS